MKCFGAMNMESMALASDHSKISKNLYFEITIYMATDFGNLTNILSKAGPIIYIFLTFCNFYL